jgi:hypothetical protein
MSLSITISCHFSSIPCDNSNKIYRILIINNMTVCMVCSALKSLSYIGDVFARTEFFNPVAISASFFLCQLHLIQSSSVGIALDYGLDGRGSRVRFPAVAGNFSLHHRVQNGSGAHPASYLMGTRGSFLGGKAAGTWSWPLTSI